MGDTCGEYSIDNFFYEERMVASMFGKNETVMCENCNLWLEKAKRLQSIRSQDLFILKNPRRVTAVNYPVRMDNGSVRLINAFRTQYNDALGPTKGGVRIHESVSQEDVTELAFLMSLKTSLMGLPYGGAKGGIRVRVEDLSEGELERVVRGYVKEMSGIFGEDKDIPAPDVNSDPRIMAWMLDEYECITGRKSPGMVTGKPIVLGGSLGRDTSTARGAFFIIQKIFGKKKGATVAIQGFGNAGSNLALMLFRAGFRVVAVSDVSGGIYRKDGLDIERVAQKKGMKMGFEGVDARARRITNEELVCLDADLLVPAALGGVITEKNANEIRAKKILEVANGPISIGAEEVLMKKGKEVVPDILANAGGVIVSYFEWVQNKQNFYWTENEVNDRLKERICSVYDAVRTVQKRDRISLRSASYVLAIGRILEAERLRGRL